MQKKWIWIISLVLCFHISSKPISTNLVTGLYSSVGYKPPTSGLIVQDAASNGSHVWTIHNMRLTQYPVKISDATDGDPSDISDDDFILQTAGYLVVSNTSDAGPGSLREALILANANGRPDGVIFDIPTTDPGYDPDRGVWTISPLSQLPVITDSSLVIDGFSQSISVGDLNSDGPEIELNGSLAGTPVHGLFVTSSKNMVRGLIINHFSASGILLSGPDANQNLITENYIGVNFRADAALPNGSYGIYIVEGSRNDIGVLEENQMSRFAEAAGDQPADRNDPILNMFHIRNFKGYYRIPQTFDMPTVEGLLFNPRSEVHAASAEAMPVEDKIGYPVTQYRSMQQGLAGGNVIAGNLKDGVYIQGEVPSDNHIVNNFILANSENGITLTGHVKKTTIFHNAIADNAGTGVLISGVNSIYNTVTMNEITRNGGAGITLDSGNEMLAAPVIETVIENTISGIGPVNSIIELYSDPEDEGGSFLGSVTSESDGRFSWTGEFEPLNITATATDAAGNTSPFSTPYLITGLILYVTTTADDGPGSLRNAIDQANQQIGPNTIWFQIDGNDPNYDSNSGVWTIRPKTRLPEIIDDNLVINGYSQAEFVGLDTNPNGPEIEIDGSLTSDVPGLHVLGAGTVIAGLVINRFSTTGAAGIAMYSVDGAAVIGCYIGTDAQGVESLGNSIGISLARHTRNTVIGPPDSTLDGNLISGNIDFGVTIVDSCMFNYITANVIGINIAGDSIPDNQLFGIHVADHCDSNFIFENLIGYHGDAGIQIQTSRGNIITGNGIGTDGSWMRDLGNHGDGIRLRQAQNTQIFSNIIGYNGEHGVSVRGQEAIGNTIRQNAISRNTGLGIHYVDGGNTELEAPTILSVSPSEVTGQAQANQIVDVYADEADEGRIYLGEAATDAGGNFLLSLTEYFDMPFVTATATDVDGNTSTFSLPVSTDTDIMSEAETPVTFAMSQNYPNPFNPETSIKYSLRQNAYVVIKVVDLLGKEVRTLVEEEKNAGYHEVVWNGLDSHGSSVASGVYFYTMKAGTFTETRKLLLLK